MRPAYLCVAFLTAAALLAQKDYSSDEPLLFPPANELVLAAQLGYRAEKDWPLDVGYESRNVGRDAERCRAEIREVRVAGPLLLAVKEGTMARLHSEAMPVSEDPLHSRGTLMLEMEFFGNGESDRASVALRAMSREYYPLRVALKSAEHFYCGHGWYAWKIRQTYTFGFAPGQIQHDWFSGAKLVVIRHGYKETLVLHLEGVLSIQANRIRRGFR